MTRMDGILGLFICKVNDEDIDSMYCRNKTIGDLSKDKGVVFVFTIPFEVFKTANKKILK